MIIKYQKQWKPDTRYLHNDLCQRYFDAVFYVSATRPCVWTNVVEPVMTMMTRACILGMQIWHVQFKPITFVPIIVRSEEVYMCTIILNVNKHGLQIKIYGRTLSIIFDAQNGRWFDLWASDFNRVPINKSWLLNLFFVCDLWPPEVWSRSILEHFEHPVTF